jgi:hypothetical protein
LARALLSSRRYALEPYVRRIPDGMTELPRLASSRLARLKRALPSSRRNALIFVFLWERSEDRDTTCAIGNNLKHPQPKYKSTFGRYADRNVCATSLTLAEFLTA